MKPLFVVIEGLDGSGGTTQSRLLRDWFVGQQKDVLLTREPSDGPVGEFIRDLMVASSANSTIGNAVLPYLFAADRRDHLDREILPALAEQKIVISDRYYHSSLAYQGLSVGLPQVAELNSMFNQPDVTFFLYLSPEISFERVQLRGLPVERFETLYHLRTVAEAYETVIGFCRARGETIVKIDANQSIEEIHHDITKYMTDHFLATS